MHMIKKEEEKKKQHGRYASFTSEWLPVRRGVCVEKEESEGVCVEKEESEDVCVEKGETARACWSARARALSLEKRVD